MSVRFWKLVVSYELPGHDAERLRNVDYRGIDLGRHRRAVRIDTDRPRPRILGRAASATPPVSRWAAVRSAAGRWAATPALQMLRCCGLRGAGLTVTCDNGAAVGWLAEGCCAGVAGGDGDASGGVEGACCAGAAGGDGVASEGCGGRLLRRRRCLGAHVVCARGGERDVAHRKQDSLRDRLDALMSAHDGPQKKCRRDDVTPSPRRC